jgi:hypothetical protein
MKKLLLTLGAFFILQCSNAQICWVSFNYDAGGNRIKRYNCNYVPPNSLTKGSESTLTFAESIEENDKQSVLSQLTSVKEEDRLKIFPNPTKEYFDIIDLDFPQKILIYDMNGKMILNSYINSARIDVSEFQAGNYLVIVKSIENKISSTIFCKI